MFFEAHERFMREIHFTEGDIEPRVLAYYITKCPELKNPLNPDEGTTGLPHLDCMKFIGTPRVVQHTWQLAKLRKLICSIH